MASLAQFGCLLLLLAIVAKAQPQDLDLRQKYHFDKLDELSQRVIGLEQKITNQFNIIESKLKMLLVNEQKSNNPEDYIIKPNLPDPKEDLNNESVADAIKQRRFADAENMILNGNYVELSKIIKDMYHNSESNVQVILDFAKSLSNTNLKYEVLSTLYEEWDEQTATLKTIALAKAYSEIIGDAEPIPEYFEFLLDYVTASTIYDLLNIIKSDDDYGNNEEAKSLSAAIVGLRDVPKKVMIGLLEKAVDEVGDRKLFQVIYTHSEPWQALIGLDYIINELQKLNRFKKSHPFDVASALSKIKSTANFDSAQSEFLDSTIKKIPKCIMNIVSIPEFCIYDKKTDSYLALQNPEDDTTPISAISRRQINNGNRNSIKWKSRRTEYFTFFESAYYTNSVMVARVKGRFDNSRDINAYKADEDMDNYKGFLIEPREDSCLIMSDDEEYVMTRLYRGAISVTLERTDADRATVWEITEC